MSVKNISGEVTASIIIPVYQNEVLLRKNLPKVIKATENKKNKIIEIIVVDDASPNNQNDFVRKEFKSVRFIKHSAMRGYSAAVNTGARSSRGKLIVLLNCDAIPHDDFLQSVFDDFENKNVFSVALREKGIYWDKGIFKNGFIGLKQGTSVNGTHETFFVTTASGVYRRDYWMKLGGLDEKVLSPSYWEDIDLSYRAAKRGFVNIWDPNAKVSFSGSVKTNAKDLKGIQKVKERNKLLFHWKNLTSRNLFRKHAIGVIRRILKEPSYIFIVWAALKRFKLAYKARKREIRETKISDEAIISKFQNA